MEEIVALRMIEQAQQPQLQHQSVSFPNIVPSKAKGSGISRTSQRGALLSSRADPGFAGSHSTSDLDSRLSLKLGSHAPGSKPRTPGSAASSTGASANLSAAARQQLAREQAVSVSESLAKYCQELQQRIEVSARTTLLRIAMHRSDNVMVAIAYAITFCSLGARVGGFPVDGGHRHAAG